MDIRKQKVFESNDTDDEKKVAKLGKELIKKLKTKEKLDSYVQELNAILKGKDVKDKDNTELYLKVLADIFSGQVDKDNKELYDPYKYEGEYDIPVKDLFPTQNEIDIKNSAKWSYIEKFVDGVDAMFGKGGFGEKFPVPVLVYNDGSKNWIIDGHHRWSQVALINPNAKLHCMVVTGKTKVTEFLKLVQGIIAGVIANRDNGETLPVGKAVEENNIFGAALKGKKLKERMEKMLGENKNATDRLLKVLGKHAEELGMEKGHEFTIEDVAKLVEKNRDLMLEQGQEPDLSWAEPRQFMPQSDKAGKEGENDSSQNSKGSALNKLTQVEGLPSVE